MKKGKILNKKLNEAIAGMGHGEILMVCDCGYPIPDDAKRVDLALTQDVPGLIEVLELIYSDFIYERVIVAKEQELYNPLLFKRISELSDRCSVETCTDTEIISGLYHNTAKFFVRTGALEPWGNIALVSGIDAATYFEKEGAIVPDYYEERVSYRENK